MVLPLVNMVGVGLLAIANFVSIFWNAVLNMGDVYGIFVFCELRYVFFYVLCKRCQAILLLYRGTVCKFVLFEIEIVDIFSFFSDIVVQCQFVMNFLLYFLCFFRGFMVPCVRNIIFSGSQFSPTFNMRYSDDGITNTPSFVNSTDPAYFITFFTESISVSMDGASSSDDLISAPAGVVRRAVYRSWALLIPLPIEMVAFVVRGLIFLKVY